MRLGQDQPLRLRLRGEEEEIGRAVVGWQRLARHRAGEADGRAGWAGRGEPPERTLVTPLPDEEQPRAGHRVRDGAEGLQDTLHALLPVEAPHVEAERRLHGKAELAARRAAVSRADKIEGDAS